MDCKGLYKETCEKIWASNIHVEAGPKKSALGLARFRGAGAVRDAAAHGWCAVVDFPHVGGAVGGGAPDGPRRR